MFPKSINIGPLTVHLYGIIIALAIYLGWLLAKKRAHIYKIPQKIFDDPILLVPLALAIFGARLYHVLDLWDYYLAHPGLIFAIWNGGLGIWGALIGVLLGFWIISKIRKIDLLSILDLSAPSLLLGQAIGRIGNYINQEAFGPPTRAPWGVFISPENRPGEFINSTHFHPTFFYEAIIDAVFFIVLIFVERRIHYSSSDRVRRGSREVTLKTTNNLKGKFSTGSNNNKRRLAPGQLFALYLILYSLGRFAVEFWRIDTATIGTIKLAHLLSVLTFAAGILLLLSKKTISKLVK
jgi:phosphatidylglycerol---prolipoprotein diacylglyceryl transferase